MIRIFYTNRFRKDVKKLLKKNREIQQDIERLIETLKENPKSGSPLGNNCYKVRLRDSSNTKGKSGGYRVITYLLESDEQLTLLTMYSKSLQSTITDKEIKAILDTINN